MQCRGDRLVRPYAGRKQQARQQAEQVDAGRKRVPRKHSSPTARVISATCQQGIHRKMSTDLNWIANYIWGIADDVLRDLH